jgi:hypothetical protein
VVSFCQNDSIVLGQANGAPGRMPDGGQGLPLSSFKMYHKRYRRGHLAHDLDQLSFGISNPVPPRRG